MNVKRKQAIDTLSAAVSNINDVKIQTDIQSLGRAAEAFINTSDKAERKKLATDYKKRHKELQDFLDDNPELVNSEVRELCLRRLWAANMQRKKLELTPEGAKRSGAG